MAERLALIVEDDPQIRDALSEVVTELGFSVRVTADGSEGRHLVTERQFALILIDLMLPGVSGAEICRAARAADSDVPIVIITAVSDEPTTVQLLDLGADDYIVKPFRQMELQARIRRATERVQVTEDGPEALEFDGLRIDLVKRRVFREEAEVQLTAREFDFLVMLARQPGRPFTRDEINEYLNGYPVGGYDRSVVSHVKRIRDKIEPNAAEPTYLLTARGYGYYFSDKVSL